MRPHNLKHAIIASGDPREDIPHRMAEIWFKPEDEQDITSIICGKAMVNLKVLE
jgi:hypothetical protein